MDSAKAGDGTLLIAGEAGTYNGPWVNPDDMRKLNGLVRYTQGTALDGFSITGMAYSNKWNSTDQVPQRAITSGQIGLFGSEDPTDGGNTNRFALSARVAGTDDAGSWKANAYAVKSQLDLFNDFTYFLADPVLGDQFHQHDDRVMAGANASRTLNGSFAGLPMETTFGVQTRYDDIDLALTDTYQRSFLSNVRSDKVGEGSVGVYAQNTVHWTDWLSTTVGWRGDYYDARVNSLFDANNSGNVQRGIGSPKFTMVVGPFNKTEFFVGAGMGMHSNDARGATITEVPTDPTTKLSARRCWSGPRAPRPGSAPRSFRGSIPRSACSCSTRIPRSSSTAMPATPRRAGQAGATASNGPTAIARAWIELDADLALTHARFVGFDSDQAAVRLARRISAGANRQRARATTFPTRRRWWLRPASRWAKRPAGSARLRWRYLASSPLTEDNAFRSPATSIFNGRVGYRLTMAGGFSSTCSICSTPGPIRFPTPTAR